MKLPPASTVRLALLTGLFVLAVTAVTSAADKSEKTPQAARIAEHPRDYAALPAADQQQVAEGLIARGQRMKIVYIALGRPDVIVTTPDAKTVTWTYRNYVPPFKGTQKNVIGKAPMTHVANDSPLNDTFEAWRNNMMKHEITAIDDPFSRTNPIAKAPGQSWSDYARYRHQLDRAPSPDIAIMINEKAKEDYRETVKEIQRIGPVTAPEPITLEVIFIDHLVSDAIINRSVSAFSP
jgi:hypothetical protein